MRTDLEQSIFEHRASLGYALSVAREIGDCLTLSDPGVARDKLQELTRYLHQRSVSLGPVHPLDDPGTPEWQRQMWRMARPLGEHRDR